MATTYYLSDTTSAISGTAALNELLLSSTQGTPATLDASIPAASTRNSFAWRSPDGDPGTTNWAGTFSFSLSVASATSLTYTTWLRRWNADTSADQIQQIPAATTHSGTGIKTASAAGVAIALTPAADDLFGFYIEATNSDMMSAQNLTLNLNSADSWVEGPWTLAAADQLPRFSHNISQAVSRAANW